MRKIHKAIVQSKYFSPITGPFGNGALSDQSKRKFKILRDEVPEPVFPMSDGSGPTPKVSYTSEKIRTGMIGIKLGMTAMWDHFGVRRPVTVVRFDENQVIANRFCHDTWKTIVGATNEDTHKVNKPTLFYFRRYRLDPKREKTEFKVSPDGVIPAGVSLNAAHFVAGQFVDVQGISRGKGFQGVMRRWNFAGGAASHGNSKAHRTLGSTGQSSAVSRVHKGKKMPGNMGNEKTTAQNLQVLKVDPHNNLLYIAGPVPSAAGRYVRVKDAVFKRLAGKCFPEGSAVPYPTFLGDVTKLPKELFPPAPTPRQIELDPFLRQKREATS